MNVPAQLARPPIVAWLGYGGLVPFVVLAAATLVDRTRAGLWHDDLLAYAAVILSFVGALHWGLAMTAGLEASQRNAMYAWSVVPSLIAFVALMVRSALGDALMIGGFTAHYWRDVRLAATAELPAWYLPLRRRLSAVAILCIAAGAFGKY